VPKRNKKNGRENLKTEKVFNMTMKEIVTNNHGVVTTEQEKKEGYVRDFISGEFRTTKKNPKTWWWAKKD
jgi:hypothetical protein